MTIIIIIIITTTTILYVLEHIASTTQLGMLCCCPQDDNNFAPCDNSKGPMTTLPANTGNNISKLCKRARAICCSEHLLYYRTHVTTSQPVIRPFPPNTLRGISSWQKKVSYIQLIMFTLCSAIICTPLRYSMFPISAAAVCVVVATGGCSGFWIQSFIAIQFLSTRLIVY